MKPDCYAYIRNTYHVPAYIGVRVKVERKSLALNACTCGAVQQWRRIERSGRESTLPFCADTCARALSGHTDVGTLVAARTHLHYLHVYIEGERGSKLYHPTTVEYLVESREVLCTICRREVAEM